MDSKNSDHDLQGIVQLLRTHLEIRNRSWMTRVHRDCFVGSDAVSFLVTQGLADDRKEAVELGKKMMKKKLIRHISDSQRFSDSYHYYRFAEDESDLSILARSAAGNGNGFTLGHGGCKWSFCSHTAHNSYVLDIALAEEIERAVSGASVLSRLHAIEKLRSRVREMTESDNPDWILSQVSTVNDNSVNIYQRKKPRGDFKNLKMEGMVGESPANFIRGILDFERRKHWEGMFEDGIIVEGIDSGELPSAIISDEREMPEIATTQSPLPPTPINKSASAIAAGTHSGNDNTHTPPITPIITQMSEKRAGSNKNTAKPARAVDDVVSFLETVDLAGIVVRNNY